MVALSNLLDLFGDACEDLFDRALAVDLDIFMLRLVVLGNDSRLGPIDLQTLADHLLRGIIGTTRLLAAQQDAANQLLLLDRDADHQINLQAILRKNLIERLGLRRRARKAIIDTTFRIFMLGYVVGNHLNYQLVGSQLTTLDAGLYLTAQLRTATDMPANHLTGRDMLDAEMLFELCCLGTLTATRRTK